MYNEKTNQRTTKMTLLRKEEGGRRFQIKAITLVLGKERVSTNVMHPTELIVLGTVLKKRNCNDYQRSSIYHPPNHRLR